MQKLIQQEVTLVVREDPVIGELGIMCKDVPVMHDEPMIALEGILIAHDILEHVNGLAEIGTIKDELEALGGIWYIRGQHADISRGVMGSMYSPIQHLQSDVLHMGSIVMCNTGIKLKHVDHSEHTLFCEEADELIEYMARQIIDECDGMTIDRDRLDEYLTCVKHSFCAGYEKACTLYDAAPRQANDMFWTIAEVVDNWLEHSELVEGDKVVLHYCFETGEARIVELEGWEKYGYESDEDYQECEFGVVPCERAYREAFASFDRQIEDMEVQNGGITIVNCAKEYYDADEGAAEEAFSTALDNDGLALLCSLEDCLNNDFPEHY
jgi:hypothetical protein